MYNDIITPAVIIDLDTVERNIAAMAEKTARSGITHRPHIKTHKSVRLAQMQLKAGAVGITAAKLSEAEVFASCGFDDILIAHTMIGEAKLRRFARLHETIDVKTTVDSMIVAEGLSEVGVRTGKRVKVLIELDGGMNRCGRQPGEEIVRFAREVQVLPGIEIIGLMAYFGKIYAEGVTPEALAEYVDYESDTIEKVTSELQEAGIPLSVVSSGSTPSSRHVDKLRGVTEVRAGNYIFYDASAVQLGVARQEDCALRVIATVVSTPLPGMATIDAGTKTLTSDKASHREGFGIVVGYPGVTIMGLNEEHGALRFDPQQVSFAVGDRIEIIPNHSCVLPNLCDSVYGVRQGKWVETIRIDARGMNV